MNTVYAKTREQLEAALAAATTDAERAQIEFELSAIPEAVDMPFIPDYTPDRKSIILGELAQIDKDSIRPLRAMADNAVTDFDRQKLAQLDARAAELRAELAGPE
jgi:hypothetical protein